MHIDPYCAGCDHRYLCGTSRLASIRALDLVDSPAEPAFDRITSLATGFLKVPVSLVSIVTDTRQFFKSSVGLEEPWSSHRQTPLSHSFCKHVVKTNEGLVVADARQNEILRHNLAITELGVVAYLGFPLHTVEGEVVGAFCVIDTKPRSWTDQEVAAVRELAALVNNELNLRTEVIKLRQAEARMEEQAAELALKTSEAEKLALVARYTDNAVVITDDQSRIEWVNEGFTRITGYQLEEVVGKIPGEFLQGPKTSQDTVQLMRKGILERKGFDVEVVNYTKTGSPYWLAIEVRPIVNDAGDVTRFIAVESDITERKLAAAERERLRRELLDASHRAGMAEIATDVLHDVGNVLNSINVSAGLLSELLATNSVRQLRGTSNLVQEHLADLADFVTKDKRGRLLPEFLEKLTTRFEQERTMIDSEIRSLVARVNHVKEIVAAQQKPRIPFCHPPGIRCLLVTGGSDQGHPGR